MDNSIHDIALKILKENGYDLKKSRRIIMLEYLKCEEECDKKADFWVDVGDALEAINKNNTKN